MSAARQSILDTAARLFAERGYELVGINEIIEKSGVAKATFYSHFRSKELLCTEWLRAAAAEASGRNSALLKDPSSAEDKIAGKFDGLIAYINECDFRGCPFSITASMVNPGSEVRQVIADYKAGARAFWQSLALEVRRDPEAARLLGDGLFLLFSGAVSEAQNARDPWPIHSAKQLALELCQSIQPAY